MLSASPEARERVVPEWAEALAHLDAVRDAACQALREDAARPSLDRLSAVIAYLRLEIGWRKSEQLRVLFCDGSGGVIRDEIMAMGSLRRAPVFPREIVARALELGASGLIMAHNHPSGDASASSEDIDATRKVAQAAKLFDIEVLDHIILARGRWTSLRAEGLV